jgi:hypothetical protein
MNKISKILFLIAFVTFVFSCSTDEKFSGSPVGNVEIVTLNATVATTTTNALGTQEVDVTITLPDNKTFVDTVSIEVTTLRQNGVGRTRGYIEIMPGENTATGKVEAVGGEFFTGTFSMFLTAINLQTVEVGRHYLITSNKIDINTGDTGLLTTQEDRLRIGVAWPNAISEVVDGVLQKNTMKVSIDRPTLADIAIFNVSPGFGKLHAISVEGTTNSPALSSAAGEYIFSVGGDGPGSLFEESQDFPYRLVIRFPDAEVKIFEGVYLGFNSSSPLVPVLKVVKTVVDGATTFTVERL